MRSKTGASKRIVVDAIIVPPGRDGVGFGHDRKGRCIEFTGERAAMLKIVKQLREAEHMVPRPTITIVPNEWPDLKTIDASVCPTHMLPPFAPEAVA